MTAIDVAGVIDDILAESIVVERSTPATSFDSRGRPVVAAPIETAAVALTHQASPREVERAGLDHGRDYRVFTTTEALRVASAAGPGDVVQYGGKRWTILALEDYQALSGLTIAIGTRINT